MSPLLFALVMEPLAIAIRADTKMEGFVRPTGEERIALYADDVLLFLGDTNQSIKQAMTIFRDFGKLSGLVINWEKSALMPIDPIESQTSVEIPQMKKVEIMKYLGIFITSDPNKYIKYNLVPLLSKFKKKIQIWRYLPLSVAGRCNLIKMLWMPQLLYILHNSPIWIGKKWFRKIDTLFRELIWKGGQSRIKLQTLQLPIREGGMAVPHPQCYFLAAQLQHIGVRTESGGDTNLGLMFLGAPHKTAVEVLEANSFTNRIPTVKMALKVWKAVKILGGQEGMTEYTPLWDNRNLQELESVGKINEWAAKGIIRLAQIYEGRTIKTFATIRKEYDVPKHTFYRYLQTRHALDAQFKRVGPIWVKTLILQKLGNWSKTKGFISEVYSYIHTYNSKVE